MLKKITVVVLLLLIPVFVFAQLKSQSNGVDLQKILKYGTNPIGLFSNSLLIFVSSILFSYFVLLYFVLFQTFSLKA